MGRIFVGLVFGILVLLKQHEMLSIFLFCVFWATLLLDFVLWKVLLGLGLCADSFCLIIVVS